MGKKNKKEVSLISNLKMNFYVCRVSNVYKNL